MEAQPPQRQATTLEREHYRFVTAYRRDNPTGPNEPEVKQKQDTLLNNYNARKTAARTAIACVMLVLGLAATAGAQTASCKDTVALNNTTLVVNPTMMSFLSPEHALVTAYTIGIVSEGSDPNTPGVAFVAQVPLPAAAVVANPSETDCYNATLPLQVQASLMLLQRVRAALKYVRADSVEAVWSGVSNPFVKAGTTAVVTGVRIRKQ